MCKLIIFANNFGLYINNQQTINTAVYTYHTLTVYRYYRISMSPKRTRTKLRLLAD